MTREHWLQQLRNYIEPVADGELAATGVVRPRTGLLLTFNLPYCSYSALDENEVNIGDEQCLLIRILDEGYPTIHKVPWENIQGLSIQIINGDAGKKASIGRAIISRQL